MTRRSFGACAAGALAGCSGPNRPEPKPAPKPKSLLLRCGWQAGAIGDTAQTAGLIRLLQQHFTEETRIVLWSNALEGGVRELLAESFPWVRIVSGETGEDGAPDNAELQQVFQETDFLLHGAGPSTLMVKHLEAWRKHTGKPYGILGATITPEESPVQTTLLSEAAFVYPGDTVSLENLKKAGITKPATGYAPDGAFSLKLSNEAKGKEFLAAANLEPKKFIAAVPGTRDSGGAAKLRQALTAWVRATGLRVLLCLESAEHVKLLKPLLMDPLPDNVKKNVALRTDVWMADEASSVYRRAVAVLSLSPHSPVIAAVNDTPGVYLYGPEGVATSQVWSDIGLKNWALPAGQPTGDAIAETLLKIHREYDSAQVDVHEAVVYARRRQAEAIGHLRRSLGLS